MAKPNYSSKVSSETGKKGSLNTIPWMAALGSTPRATRTWRMARACTTVGCLRPLQMAENVDLQMPVSRARARQEGIPQEALKSSTVWHQELGCESMETSCSPVTICDRSCDRRAKHTPCVKQKFQ